ncbi:MAG: glutathione S-transferase N-terminal domain-containing protein [Acetobacteraceae bacterium]|nr:glutathione S-transferase N-terminal domain-containing protein [Acetobacteraceae bacterium]
MILIGQYDSPFVRRVAIAFRLYEMEFEHRPWSTFGDGDKIAPFNPLRRVPTLVLFDGEVVIDSTTILDFLDEEVGPSRAMLPEYGPARRAALKICALSTGLADKAVALVYEQALHAQTSEIWLARCRDQVEAVLDALEVSRAASNAPFWFGHMISHADIAFACAWRFVTEAHPSVVDIARWPALAQAAAHCEALPAFDEIKQVFIPPR